jgi:hypothetical protein
MRLNSYAFPHKALRYLLAKVSKAAGNADPAYPESIQVLKSLFNELFYILEEHAKIEDEWVLPELEKRMPGSTQENHEEHERLDRKVESLAQMVSELNEYCLIDDFNRFYLSFSAFHSEYLQHMLLEEEDVLEKIWMNFTEEELMTQHHEILDSFTPEKMLKMFKYIIPSLNYSERSMAMSGLKMNASEEFFQEVLQVVRKEMEQNEFDIMLGELPRIMEK